MGEPLKHEQRGGVWWEEEKEDEEQDAGEREEGKHGEGRGKRYLSVM